MKKENQSLRQSNLLGWAESTTVIEIGQQVWVPVTVKKDDQGARPGHEIFMIILSAPAMLTNRQHVPRHLGPTCRSSNRLELVKETAAEISIIRIIN